MKRASILVQIATLVFASMAITLALSFAIIIVAPAPSPPRMSVVEAAAALRSSLQGRLSVRDAATPPGGLRSDLIEGALSRVLRTPASDLRAVWTGLPGGLVGDGQNVVLIGRRDVLIESDKQGFTMRYGQGAVLDSHTPLPQFVAALRLRDGRWRIASMPDPFIATWRQRILWALLIGSLVLAVPVWLVSRQLVSPIRQLEAAARQVVFDAAAPFPTCGPREIHAVAIALNQMRARVVAEAGERSRMLAAVAHDLRTPLTAVRLRADAMPEPGRTRIVADLERMGAMIEQVLDYVLLGVRGARFEPIDLAALAAECVAERTGLGDPVECVSSSDCTILADPLLLRRALDNLIDNGVRYGGATRVMVEADPNGVAIQVEDEGAGIPEPKIDQMMEPFQRLDTSRSREGGGIGLGLSIVRDIAIAHGGRLTLENSVGGFCAMIWLPTGANK